MEGTFTLFGLTGYWYGLLAAAGTLLTLLVTGVLGYLRRLPAGTVRALGLVGVLLGVACSRGAYCLLNLGTFVETYENPWLMLRFWDGGFSMTGLLVGLTLAAFLASRMTNARFADVLDSLCAALGLLIAALCAGQGFTTLGVGKVVAQSALTDAAPWLFLIRRAGVNVEYRLAVYRYEAVCAVALFAVMLTLFVRSNKRQKTRPGDLALLFFSLYGATQVFWESLRDDGHLLLTFLRAAQLCAALMPLVASAIFTRRYVRLTQRADGRIALSWLCLLLCVGGLVLLEFSLDGRLSWGNPSMGRDYAIMAVLCAALAFVPCSLGRTLQKRLYCRERFQVRL